MSSGLYFDTLTDENIINTIPNIIQDKEPLSMSLWRIIRAQKAYPELLAQSGKNYTCIGENRYMYRAPDRNVYIFTMYHSILHVPDGVYVVKGQDDPWFESVKE